MQAFGETVLAWRLARGMTQANLARGARIPRPNLSAIERGEREVTLKTLRALALALDVRPGILVDGNPPDSDAPPLSRAAIVRIARAAAGRGRGRDAREVTLIELLRQAAAARLSNRRAPTRLRAHSDRAYFSLRSRVPNPAFAELIKHFSDETGRRGT